MYSQFFVYHLNGYYGIFPSSYFTMASKILKGVMILMILMIVILLFTIIDLMVHSVSDTWSVPEYYFKNKIPFGFLWWIVGIFCSKKIKNIWWKSGVIAGIIAIALQMRYFIEGYAISFVFLFLLFHFIILYLLFWGMFFVDGKIYPIYSGKASLKKIISCFILLAMVIIGTYYTVFKDTTNTLQEKESPI